MAEQTLVDAYQRAISTNQLYSRNRARWQFYLDSYNGGDDFRRGAYLTRYALETDQDYAQRLKSTPLDNQCKSVISLYVSFLFRQSPKRDWDQFEYNPVLESILEDADCDGRSMDAFMRDVAVWSGVFGHVWICVAKPNVGAMTQADELAVQSRPYMNVYSPLVVTDWTWNRNPNGSYSLDYIKVVEEVNDTYNDIVEWTPEVIRTTRINNRKKEALEITEVPNELGRLPWIPVYAERSPVRGLGISQISDIADQQLMIANELSEVYDSIRLDSHPSLVATETTNVSGAAAGQVITLPENIDPALKPYVLQFQGGQISQIYESINNRRKMIDSMGNIGSVRAVETREISGIAMATEFQLLNARLCSIADNMELAEELIWEEVCRYLGIEWDGEIEYSDDFALRNVDNELDQLMKMKSLSSRPEVQQAIDYRIGEILDIETIEAENPEYEETSIEQHPTTTPENRQQHIQDMIMEGYEDDEILDIHPEITAEDILAAKQALLNLNG